MPIAGITDYFREKKEEYGTGLRILKTMRQIPQKQNDYCKPCSGSESHRAGAGFAFHGENEMKTTFKIEKSAPDPSLKEWKPKLNRWIECDSGFFQHFENEELSIWYRSLGRGMMDMYEIFWNELHEYMDSQGTSIYANEFHGQVFTDLFEGSFVYQGQKYATKTEFHRYAGGYDEDGYTNVRYIIKKVK